MDMTRDELLSRRVGDNDRVLCPRGHALPYANAVNWDGSVNPIGREEPPR